MDGITTHDITLREFIKESSKNAITLYFSPLKILFTELKIWLNFLKRLRDNEMESSQEQAQQIVAVTDKLRQEMDRAVEVLCSLQDTIEEAARWQTRIGLSQAYLQFSAETIRSEDSTNITQELFYPQYTHTQVRRIQIMFTLLNALYMEWCFSKEKLHSEDEFNSTLKSLIEPFAKSTQNAPQNRFLIDDFGKIFVDFPDEFKKTVLSCIKNVPLN